MYTIIEKEGEIRDYQTLLEKILKYQNAPIKRKISHPRTKEDFDKNKDKLYDIFWSSQFEFWSAFDHNKPKKKNRYWNIFGLKDPNNNKSLIITVEICIPIKGEDKSIAGLFVIDKKTNNIAIVRRGKLSRKPMKYFWANYNGKTIDLIDGTKVALIGLLPKDESQYLNFQKNVRDFIIEIDRIKNIVDDSAASTVIKKNNKVNKSKAIPIKNNNSLGLSNTNISSPLILSNRNTFLSVEAAKKYYINLLAYHKIDNVPATRIPYLKNVLENELLAEATGIQHYYDKTDNGIKVEGQKTWLLDKKVKNKDCFGSPSSGVIPSDIVSGIINIFEQRNIAEHDKQKITHATYLGVFDLMARTISCLSGTSIPEEIIAICNSKNP